MRAKNQNKEAYKKKNQPLILHYQSNLAIV